MAKCAFRSLSELCADFKRKSGSSGSGDSKDTALPDTFWEVPSDPSEDEDRSEDQTYNPRAIETKSSKRSALSSLDKLQEKFQAKQKDNHDKDTKAPQSKAPARGASSEAADGSAKGGSQAKTATAPHTGTLTKLVERKGFGFIVPDVEGTGDVFLHCSELMGRVSGDMFVGMRVRYDVEVDSRSGKTRARNAVIVEAEVSGARAADKRAAAPAASLPEGPDAGKRGKEAGQKQRAGVSFTRGELLGMFRKMGRPYGKASKLGILSVRFPKIPRQHRWGYSDSDSSGDSSDNDSSWMEEDACLDDEDLIATMETRLSKESGFDIMNKETFGDSCMSGWSFEEAVAANAKLGSCHLFAAGLPPAGADDLLESGAADDLLEFGCGPTTAGSADGADTSAVESPVSPTCQSRAESPDDPAEGSTEAEVVDGDKAVPRYILEGLQLQ